MVKAVLIGSRNLSTQRGALEHFKSLLNRYDNGERINDPNDHADLVGLIERYDPVLEAVGEPAKGCG